MFCDRLPGMTIKQAAEQLGLNPMTVLKYCQRGVTGTKMGRVWVLGPNSLGLIRKYRKAHPAGRRGKSAES